MTFMLAKASESVRHAGDPQVIETGPSSLKRVDRAGRMLGWFSIGLGMTQLFAPKLLTRWLGVEGREGFVRAMGAREIGHGMLCLSTETHAGAWSRVGGDMLDLAALASAHRVDNPKKTNVAIAMGVVAGCALADLAVAQSIGGVHSRKAPPRDFSDRSGFPNGVAKARGAAADVREKAERLEIAG